MADKVQVFWRGHKNLKKSPTCFDTTAYTSKQVGDFFQILWLSHIVFILIVREEYRKRYRQLKKVCQNSNSLIAVNFYISFFGWVDDK